NGPSLRSTDGGHTFAPWAGAPHVRALAERDGVLFAAADDLQDPFAVGRSDDGGAHWTSLLRFRDITGPRACGQLPARCAQAWETVRQRFQPADMAPSSPADLGGSVNTPPRGCGCALGASERDV